MISITTSQAQSFRDQGFLILERALACEELQVLSNVCNQLMDEPAPSEDAPGLHKINRGKDRQFLRHRHLDFPDLQELILGQDMKALIEPLLGKHPTLFNEQFVVKGPKTGAAFAWHQDSGYVGFDHKPYLSVWIAIDDTTLDNGALYVMPRNLDTETEIENHTWDESGSELVGYQGGDLGEAVPVPAGSIVAFSSLTLHRSSPNITDKSRRAYLVQFSDGVLMDPRTGQPKRFSTPL